MQEFLNREYFDNTIWMYLIAAGIFIAAVILTNIFKLIILKRLKKWSESTETTIDNFIVSGIEKTILPLLYYGAFFIAINTLKLHPKFSSALNIASIILITFFVIKLIISILRYTLNVYLQRKGEGEIEDREKQLKGITTLVSFIIWAVGFIFLLDNLGFEISAVIAGLGIGGIAIALAAQTILGDLFSYFVIFFDKPFKIGDFIIINDKMGAVEYIGIKTTRLRSLGGEQLIFSNTDLVNSRIHNYKRMERRRVVFKLGVLYETTYAQLKQIPPVIKNIIEEIPDATFDRCHFFSYGDFSLVIETVYYVMSADYNKYADIQQEINFKIFEEFEKMKIGFAYPTQTLYLNKQNGFEEPKTEIIKN